MDDFSIFSDSDRQDVSYGACIAGSVGTGAAVGRFLGLQGFLAGAAAGLVVGLIACKRLTPVIERKLFSRQARFTDAELLHTLRVIRDQTGVRTKSDALYLLQHARAAAVRGDQLTSSEPKACTSPRVAAARILAHRHPNRTS